MLWKTFHKLGFMNKTNASRTSPLISRPKLVMQTCDPTSVRTSDGRGKVGGIFMVLEKITEDQGRGREGGRERMSEREPGLCVRACVHVCVCGRGRGLVERKKSNPPRALHTSLFASQMFPQTLSVGCGPRRVESQYGFNWLVFLDSVRAL